LSDISRWIIVNWQPALAFCTAVGVFLGPYLASRLRIRHEERQAHFNEIKDKVFTPLLIYLTAGYIPILERWRPNIAVSRTAKQGEGVQATDDVRAQEYKLVIVDPLDQLIAHPLSHELYNDVKENHFRDFVRDWESFKEKFAEYNKRCLVYAEELRSLIIEQVNMPERSDGDGNWVDANELAAYIFKIQLGVAGWRLELKVDGEQARILLGSSTQLACGTQEELKRCMGIINELCNKDDKAKNLIERGGKLIDDAVAIEKELRSLSNSFKLPGSCQYIPML